MQIANILKKDMQAIYGVISVFSIPFVIYLVAGIMNLFRPTFINGEVTISIVEIFSPTPNSIFIYSSSLMLIVLGFGAMVFVPPDVFNFVSLEAKSFGLSIKQIPLRRIYKICLQDQLLFTVRFDPINFKSREWATFEIRSDVADIPINQLRRQAATAGLEIDEQRRQLRSRCDVEELPWRILQFSRVLLN